MRLLDLGKCGGRAGLLPVLLHVLAADRFLMWAPFETIWAAPAGNLGLHDRAGGGASAVGVGVRNGETGADTCCRIARIRVGGPARGVSTQSGAAIVAGDGARRRTLFGAWRLSCWCCGGSRGCRHGYTHSPAPRSPPRAAVSASSFELTTDSWWAALALDRDASAAG